MSTQRKIQLVAFDLDGTLVDAYQAVRQSLNFIFQSQGLPLVQDEIVRRSVGWGDEHLLQSFFPGERIDPLLSLYRRHHQDALKRGVRFLPGARRLLEDLNAQKYKLAIASNRPTRFTHIILQHLKIKEYFDCVLCADRVSRPKPSGVILKRILEKFSLKPSQALYVGDMAIDVQAGHRARVKTVAVLTGSSTSMEIAVLKPYKIIERVSAVSEILKRI